MNNKIYNLCVVSLGGMLGFLVGGYDKLFQILCIIIVIDTITGILKSWKVGEYSSSEFKSGLFKKSGYFLSLLMVVQLDNLAGNTGLFRGAMITFTISNEMLSIVENLGIMGVQFPKRINDAIAVLHDKSNKDNN